MKPGPNLLALLLAALIALPARADLTATYRRANSNGALTVEVADDASIRVGFTADQFKLWRAGQGYQVTAGPGGPLVMRIADIAAARAGMQAPAMPPWVEVGTVRVAGRSGTKYMIRGAETRPGARALVISRDPALAALGDAFRRYYAMEQANFPAGNRDERESFRAALSTGVPIVYYDWTLDTISTAPIPSARFRLPAPPMQAAEVNAYWGSGKPGQAADDTRHAADRMVRRAVFAAGRLWLLTDRGIVSSVAPGERTRRGETAPGSVIDLCAVSGAPVVLARGEAGLRFWRGSPQGWQPLAEVASGREDRVAAVGCAPGRLVVLTDKHAILIEGGRERSVPLSEDIARQSVITTPLAVGGDLYVGLDAGEWGGGLARIDLASGAVTWPTRSDTGPCSGPLDRRCDPVNGIAREPGKPDCLVVAIGLVHMMAHGRLTEICGNDIRRLYYKPYTTDTAWPSDPPAEPFNTVAFFGLAEVDGSMWAVGNDGLYTLGGDGRMRFRKMPPFDEIDGVAVSFAVPGIALVRTAINARVSVSGVVPMLVPR